MSRLIDADALDRAFTDLRWCTLPGAAENTLAHWGDRKDWCLHGNEIEKLIADAPTVDAIPVDWIVQRMNETSSGLGMNIELNYALFTAGVEWERWKKEHGMEAEE